MLSRTTKQVYPWRRFFARIADLLIFSIVFDFIIIPFFVRLFFHSNVEGFVNAFVNAIGYPVRAEIIWNFILYSIFIPAEAAFVTGTGTTPAKWIFGISVLDIEGEKLRYSAALKRAFLVWIQGQWLGLPRLSFCAWLLAYNRLINTGTTLWDTSTKSIVDHKEWGIARATASIFVVISILANYLWQVYWVVGQKR